MFYFKFDLQNPTYKKIKLKKYGRTHVILDSLTTIKRCFFFFLDIFISSSLRTILWNSIVACDFKFNWTKISEFT